ncbi:LysR family transcriptional regulator [Phenylobacterium kunshanense]|uniref:LysR family transcriptional regulator n=1 Tax=Phenylobacterium kunshanense TaxID=1445034 RepID=A0A328BDH2_9CAUL|nr:LysR family transcriptional regulator [Phenylobacterium kunshanense]RAK64977.1 LysR family transcriptional regulator [Phenylobacterium kunshanense]
MPALPDLNLLLTLDVLLSEGSVARAAERLRLSPSAMSRALARLREATGDPLLVRAGRGLVATPRAEALRARVHDLVQDAQAVLRPDDTVDLAALQRTFTLRTSDGFVENFGPALIARAAADAPGVRLNFLQKPDKDSAPLRDGRVDLETGVVDTAIGPEVRARALFEDRLVAVVRDGHPLTKGAVTAGRYLAARHVVVSRTGFEADAVDLPFLPAGLQRRVDNMVGGFSAAIALAAASNLVATVPDRHTRSLRQGLHAVPVPLPTTPFTVSMLWHPRLDADPAHRWLRACLREVCAPTG